MKKISEIINNRIIYLLIKYFVMVSILLYVIYSYFKLPVANKLLPTLSQLCPQNMVNYLDNLIQSIKVNGANFPIYNLIFVFFLIVITLLLGNVFCSIFCPLGTIQEIISKLGLFIREKIFKNKINITIPEKTDRILKCGKYVVLSLVLIFSVFTTTYFTSITIRNIPVFQLFNPWMFFEYISNSKVMLSIAKISLISFICICLFSLFIDRFYCKYLCPSGAIYKLLSKLSLIKKDNNCNHSMCKKCKSCKICENNNSSCHQNISLKNFKKVINPTIYILTATIIFCSGLTILRQSTTENTTLKTEFTLKNYVNDINRDLKATNHTPITVKDYLAKYNLIGRVPENATMLEFLHAYQQLSFEEVVKIKFENDVSPEQIAKTFKIPKDTDLSQSWESVMRKANASAVISSVYGDLYYLSGNSNLSTTIKEMFPKSSLVASENMLYTEILDEINKLNFKQFAGDKVFNELYKPCCFHPLHGLKETLKIK